MNKLFTSLILITALISFHSCAQKSDAFQLDAKSFASLIEKSTDEWIIDVRTKKEFEGGHIATAINMDFYAGDFQKQLETLPKDNPILIYCLSGSRSNAAVDKLRSMGYTGIYHLDGGIQSWKQAGLSLEGESSKTEKFTLNDFKSLISSQRLVMIDYYAPWCLPCRKMKPYIEQLASEFKGRVKVVQINIDEAGPLFESLKLVSVPVIAFYIDGIEVKRLNGFQSEEVLRSEIGNLAGK